MTGRVLLGPGGIRVSKPGVDVLTGGADDMLIDLSRRSAQVIQAGRRDAVDPTPVPLPSGLSAPPMVFLFYERPPTGISGGPISGNVNFRPSPMAFAGNHAEAFAITAAHQIQFSFIGGEPFNPFIYLAINKALD